MEKHVGGGCELGFIAVYDGEFVSSLVVRRTVVDDQSIFRTKPTTPMSLHQA